MKELVINNEELMLDWDWVKNSQEGLDPNILTCGSNKTAHWKCHVCGHEWTTRIERKNRGSKCKMCLAQESSIAPKEKSLATLYPMIAKEWDYELNKITPDKIYPQSNLLYHWICSLGHRWQDSASHRVARLNGCPFCSNHKVLEGFNDLKTTHPHLLNEWDFEENEKLGIRPTELTQGSKKEVFWKCSMGHSWKVAVYRRTTNKEGCPHCKKELRISYPEKIVAFYISQLFENAIENFRSEKMKNLELDIFIPSLNVGVEYDGCRWHKNINKDAKKDSLCDKNGIKLYRIRENGCPNYKSSSYKTYVNYRNNDDLTKSINEIISDICRKNKLKKEIDINIDRDSTKIISKVLTLTKEKSIANSPLIKEWDLEKNEGINPELVPTFSNKKFWWKCDLGHSWQAQASKRSIGSNCPYCSGQKVLAGFNDLESQYPNVAKEWDYIRNKKNPNEVSSKSNKSFWWICSKCGYNWKTKVYVRTGMNCGCPQCSKETIRRKNIANAIRKTGSLKETNPVLSSEFDLEKNKPITPEDITANHNSKIWWVCSKCGYKWEASPSSRKQGAGCPHCSGRVPMIGVDDLLTLNPELCKEWDYSKNKILPSKLLPGSSEEAWWVCSKCGYKWKTQIKIRGIMGCGCPKCGHLKTASASFKRIINVDTGKIYISIAEATKDLGLSKSSISNCLCGKSETAGGYHWKYID